MKKYDIAAYIWPAYTGDEPRTRIFWPEGIGEWQSVLSAAKKYEGHSWPRKPVWGYVNEADPYVMEMEIETATDHGVNVFIYDWYWYDNRPFLETCLNDGFLRAKNNQKMKFYLMWANHDATSIWDKRNAGVCDSVIWSGVADEKQFRVIGERWIKNYFVHPCYYKINGEPVVSIYDLQNFLSGLGGAEAAREALDWLQNEAVKAGLPGIHFQFVKWGKESVNLSGVDQGITAASPQLMNRLGFSSLTHYQFAHFADMNREYQEIMPDELEEWREINHIFKIPYFPHVSVGCDNNPRFHGFRKEIVKNNGPENFEALLRHAKDYSDKNNITPLITINSWNEWTETSYLEPDDLYGYGYLEAVKRVFLQEKI